MNVFASNFPAVGFVTGPIIAGYGWTLTSYLGEFISELEARFGERDRSYTPLGIEFAGTRPQVWYPGNRKHVSVMLTHSASLEPARALYQLAHEAVHLLAPSGGRSAPIVEEGVAHAFAGEISVRHGLSMHAPNRPYDYAVKKLEQLITIEPNAIKLIREQAPSFCSWTFEIIRTVIPSITDELAMELCEPFQIVESRLAQEQDQ